MSGDALASGARSATFASADVPIDTITERKPDPFECKCGGKFETAKLFVEHLHETDFRCS